MDPITASILVGGMLGTSFIGMYQADKQAKAAAKAQEKAQDRAVKNQNRLIEEGFQKRRSAMGLDGTPQNSGLIASQTGGVLTSVTDGNQASGL